MSRLRVIREAAEAAAEKDRACRRARWKETERRLDTLPFAHGEYLVIKAEDGPTLIDCG